MRRQHPAALRGDGVQIVADLGDEAPLTLGMFGRHELVERLEPGHARGLIARAVAVLREFQVERVGDVGNGLGQQLLGGPDVGGAGGGEVRRAARRFRQRGSDRGHARLVGRHRLATRGGLRTLMNTQREQSQHDHSPTASFMPTDFKHVTPSSHGW